MQKHPRWYVVTILVLSVVVVACYRSFSTGGATDMVNAVSVIAADMQLPHEGQPHGVPFTYDWALKPRLGLGNTPGTFAAMTAWGQVYEDAQGNPATNTRVEITGLKAYMLSKRDHHWHLLQDGQQIDGAAYREDFANDVNQPADMRSDADGRISVSAGGGYNYHFWPAGRASIDPGDVAGIFTTVQARLVLDNPEEPDDRAQARYLLSMGGDYWRDLHAPWDNFRTNGDIGIGRFKYVTSAWQSFNMTTLTEAELQTTPPPLE